MEHVPSGSEYHYVQPSLCMMLLTGFGMIVRMASCNKVLQTIVDEDGRGRIMTSGNGLRKDSIYNYKSTQKNQAHQQQRRMCEKEVTR
jgi:hypothetical protein